MKNKIKLEATSVSTTTTAINNPCDVALNVFDDSTFLSIQTKKPSRIVLPAPPSPPKRKRFGFFTQPQIAPSYDVCFGTFLQKDDVPIKAACLMEKNACPKYFSDKKCVRFSQN